MKTDSLQANMAHRNVQFGLVIFFLFSAFSFYLMNFGRACPPRLAAGPTLPCLPLCPNSGIREGSHVHIIAVSCPVDSGVSEKQTRCMFLSEERGIIEWSQVTETHTCTSLLLD